MCPATLMRRCGARAPAAAGVACRRRGGAESHGLALLKYIAPDHKKFDMRSVLAAKDLIATAQDFFKLLQIEMSLRPAKNCAFGPESRQKLLGYCLCHVSARRISSPTKSARTSATSANKTARFPSYRNWSPATSRRPAISVVWQFA